MNNTLNTPFHVSVMEKEVLSVFDQVSLKKFVDSTVGLGGHASSIIKAHAYEIETVYCFDEDIEALNIAKQTLNVLPGKKYFFNINASEMKKELAKCGVRCVDGILCDLGISTLQLKSSGRGFSFLAHGEPLDMRMNICGSKTAFDVVQFYSDRDLFKMFSRYSDLKNIRLIVKKIVEAREKESIKTVGQLSATFNHGKMFGLSRKSSNPLFQIFQAIRMEVNQELQNLEAMLHAAFELLSPNGVLAVISFHSIEDRVVKKIFQNWERPMEAHPAFPGGIPSETSLGENLFKKPMVPDVQEISQNPASRSAKLRAFRRVLNAG